MRTLSIESLLSCAPRHKSSGFYPHAEAGGLIRSFPNIRLENSFWGILEEIAKRDDLQVPQMITRLYHESIDAGHDMGNFTSFLRVCAMRYLSLQAHGQISSDINTPINTLNADEILLNEKLIKLMLKS
ncbi:ribbon-helix-helix domain-containing protein [Marinomonas sp. PE14-40]|uniref:ribbon-helix-helix domain-containing protein n=1 Tax=Marinomonas sp. PE14-40 TaxID=3060621 RepID=UPI003F66C6D5